MNQFFTTNMDMETPEACDNTPSMGHSVDMTSKFDNTQPYHEGRKLIVLLRTSQCLQFKSLLECLKELLDEVNFEFIEGKGVRMVTLDPGRIACLHVVIDSLEYFYAKKKVLAGLNMAFLYKMVRSLTSGDLMEWRIFEDSPTELHLEISNSERKTKTINAIKLLDLDEDEISIPSIQFDRVVSMPATDLTRYVREMSAVSNIIGIKATKNQLHFSANGEMASSQIVISPTSIGLNWRHSQDVDDIEGFFYVKYLEKFCKCNVESNVEMYLKQNFPVILLYQLSIGCMRFALAQVKKSDEE